MWKRWLCEGREGSQRLRFWRLLKGRLAARQAKDCCQQCGCSELVLQFFAADRRIAASMSLRKAMVSRLTACKSGMTLKASVAGVEEFMNCGVIDFSP